MTASLVKQPASGIVGAEKIQNRWSTIAIIGLGLFAISANSHGTDEAHHQANSTPPAAVEAESDDADTNHQTQEAQHHEQAMEGSANVASAKQYRALFDLVPTEDRHRIFWASTRGGDAEERRELFGKYRHMLEPIRAASLGPVPDWEHDLAAEGLALELPELGKKLTLTNLTGFALREAASDHRFDDALDHLATILRLARHALGLENQRLPLHNFIATSHQIHGISNLTEVLNVMSAEQRGQMLRLVEQYADLGPLSISVRNDRIWLAAWLLEQTEQRPEVVRRLFVEFDSAEKNEEDDDDTAGPLTTLFDQDRPGFIRQVRRIDELLEQALSFVDLPYAEVMPRLKPFIEEVAKEPAFVRESVYSVEHLIRLRIRQQTQRAMLRAAVHFLDGDAEAFLQTTDPAGNGPFTLSLEPGDNGGFTLHSVFEQRDGTRFSMTFPGSGPDN